ncbi:MAG: hypothetical protein JJ975_09840 [Bacteroidia bacterium]|nr:hypothetical protein [Bacteroidia bacterium]
MRKIIVLRGKANTGKTTKINQIAQWIITNYQPAGEIDLDLSDLTKDSKCVLVINNISIGIFSKGDVFWDVKNIDSLLLEGGTPPDIIICSCRTRGKGYQHIVKNYNYSNGWLSAFVYVQEFSDIEAQVSRDSRILNEIKTRLTGLQKL